MIASVSNRQARVVIALLALILLMGGVLAGVTYFGATRSHCFTTPVGDSEHGYFGYQQTCDR